MSSSSAQPTALPKAANNQAATPSYTPAATGGLDSSASRRASASLGSGSSARNISTARNNQARKNQHKRHRRPRLDDEDVFAEAAAVNSTMSRKGQTSITHLMNFSLPPRPQPHHASRGVRRNPNWGMRSGYHPADKARYVHANYRFIVNPANNYHAQATNADVHLDWDTVLQVLVSTDTQATSCPICLSTPVAPRMAKCGHIFCLPCLIRYMHSTDDTNPVPEKKARWKKCPICWDGIYISETRPVGWYTSQNNADTPVEGGDVVLRLVTRKPASTLALPHEGCEILGPDDDIPWHHIADVPDYARIMKGGEDYMSSQYEAEIKDLQRQEHEDELMFGDETTWTRKAIAAVNEAKEKIHGIGNPPQLSRQTVERPPQRPPITFDAPAEGVPDFYLLQHAAKSGQSSSIELPTPSNTGVSTVPALADPANATPGEDTISSAISKLEINASQEARKDTKKDSSSTSSTKHAGSQAPHPLNYPFYFYQALPHFYLSPLDIRILKASFGDYSQFPSTILPRIEHISTGHVVDEELRKRMKYLGHLPFGCEVNFLECDWTDVVSPAVLEKFEGDISRRRRRNREKEAREEKERIRAEKNEEELRWAAARRRRSSITAPPDQPFSDRDFQPLGPEGSFGTSTSPVDMGMSSASPPWSSSRSRNRPSFNALASPSTSPPGPRTVWGTAVIPSKSPQPDQAPTHAADDGWLQGWERELLAEQELLSSRNAGGAESATTAPSTGGGKKKKNKKITLMSTTARRAA
ncbi:hypothetical protein AJ80_05515 [Polytolypa hystricis UAMH7299]|uniref:RING-type domain-containing protein n=1 Tax=Polytolypa hystricis (strain UAMH7299) TaxID=1447883 RepID=A0A2B7Y3U6_POLH7|nr:hypothetical protein AJ80_05515 [Polytolypa hystricis UAMH7299]